VSSANNISSDTELILRGRSFIHILNIRDPITDPWGTPFPCTPVSEKIISCIMGFYFKFMFSIRYKGLEPIFRHFLKSKEI
jgi:hypothetical protein